MEQMSYLDRRVRDCIVRQNVDAFLNEIESVCKKHNMSLGHEDNHGAFLISEYSDENIEWLKEARLSFIHNKGEK